MNKLSSVAALALSFGCSAASIESELDSPESVPHIEEEAWPEEKIGDGIHCTNAVDEKMSPGMRNFLEEAANHFQESLSSDRRIILAQVICPNSDGFEIDEGGHLYVLETVEGEQEQVDPFLHAVLEVEGYVHRVKPLPSSKLSEVISIFLQGARSEIKDKLNPILNDVELRLNILSSFIRSSMQNVKTILEP